MADSQQKADFYFSEKVLLNSLKCATSSKETFLLFACRFFPIPAAILLNAREFLYIGAMTTNYTKYVADGRAVEMEFAETFTRLIGGQVTPTDAAEDRTRHIDLHIALSVDVKGTRKNRRTDQDADTGIIWLEVRNVYGARGWLFGDADAIVFDIGERWLIVNRHRLADWLFRTYPPTDAAETTGAYALHKYYKRHGRRDVIIKVRTEEVLPLGITIRKYAKD